ncbi:MAG: HPF/RaiA family ribosome-associated protein [Deltaproteobacteria bacterium]|nr:HPF/RaiA family ribosome-associated protein [Deltaproteobacteria bacterium]
MQVPLQITFRNMDASEALEAEIHKRIDKLAKKYEQLVSCRIVVEAPQQHRRKGGLYKIRIDMTCPEGKVAVNREPPVEHHAHEDVYVALRDAINAAERQLDAYTERRKGHVKVHEEPPAGRITFLSPMENYGRITTVDGREIYFHRNSVLHENFDTLTINAPVTFHEEEGEHGPQASTVKIEK